MHHMDSFHSKTVNRSSTEVHLHPPHLQPLLSTTTGRDLTRRPRPQVCLDVLHAVHSSTSSGSPWNDADDPSLSRISPPTGRSPSHRWVVSPLSRLAIGSCINARKWITKVKWYRWSEAFVLHKIQQLEIPMQPDRYPPITLHHVASPLLNKISI
jgi:hypothetical protein